MAPVEWICQLCQDILLEPLTLPCCGESFCKTCLQQWTVVKLDEGAPKARCPSGCGKQIDYRLPSVSKLLSSWLESAHGNELEERRRDQEEEDIHGFSLWQEVAASRDLQVGSTLAIAFGTSGIVIGRHEEEDRVKVKFDTFLFGMNGVFNVSPDELLPQVPSGFGVQIGQRVLASQDLIIGSAVAVPFATLGTVLGPSGVPERIAVRFDSVAEGQPHDLSVQAFEILPHVNLIGGFRVAQNVTAVENIMLQDTILVPEGAVGKVLAQYLGRYSDTRLTVMFEGRLDGRSEVCAAGAAIVTQPMDVVKTKMQIHRMMTSRDDGFRRVKVARFFATFRETHQATGLRGLWAGGSARLCMAAAAGMLLGPALEYAQLISSDATRPLRRQLDLGEDPGRTIVHPRASKEMFIDVKL
ncbi:BFAR [Symbiodinium natans]|uniref:BFAR protein n=1 Tax=Symbiodinium natans TaxID=878477 RepID=A0A812J1F5_9DINO|nr:BFAR [Symbiodinium natans]